ncbi:hypothetical protein [Microbulbifer sp. ANSA005]|uniref:hypothetical protein n=1 Tax=Microbulbifer sp. ANSA005 TaxID=3243362 RepID=UPI0040410970
MNNFIGKWAIIEMEQWDQEYIDLVEPDYFNFEKGGQGQFVFGTVNGFIDCRYDNEKHPTKVDFSWEGSSEHDPVSGRGWFKIKSENSIYGMLFIYNSDESWVKATKK